MENFLRFLSNFKSLFLFLFLEAIAIFLIVEHNNYQRYVVLSSTNSITANVFQTTKFVSDYFGLKSTNEVLTAENSRLHNQLELMSEKLNKYELLKDSTVIINDSTSKSFNQKFIYRTAEIINKTTNKQQNYITINKGLNDGIKVDMGVTSDAGIIGVVQAVSDNYALVMPIININSNISCKLDSSNNFGTLSWNGYNFKQSQLSNIPSHVKITKGESVSTSGFSTIFPEGILIGHVISAKNNKKTQSFELNLALNTDFTTVRYVYIIEFVDKQEIDELLSSAVNSDIN